MLKLFSVFYSLIGYFGFLGGFLYLVGFLGNFIVPKTVNSGAEGPVLQALLINAVLVALFGLHHSICAKPEFKKWLTKLIPPHLERSTYVIIADLFFFLLLWQWRPMTAVIWDINAPALRTIIWIVFGAGWFIVVLASFLINHFDLFGLRQVYLYLQGKEYTHVPFKVTFLYKFVRHPIMLGWFIGFWATPYMTLGHLTFAVAMTFYGVVGIFHEEKTLRRFLGSDYEAYRERTPMILPFLKLKK